MASIARRPDGRWRARYRDDRGREHSKHFPRKVEAQAWLDEVTATVITGTYVDPSAGRVTLGEFYETWSGRQIWAAGTRRAMDLAVKSTPFLDTPLIALRRSHIESWVKSMSAGTDTFARPLAASTIHTRTQNLRSVLRSAVADRLLPRDPSERVRLPRRRRAEAAMKIPEPSTVGTLMRAADDEFRVFIALCAFAGLRLGEAAALQVSDIDFLRRTVSVSRQVQRGRAGAVELTPPKSGSERVVYLAPGLVDLIAAHVQANVHGDWLFYGTGDQPPHQNTIGHRWRTTLSRAGITGVKLHDLRHFFASGLIASGCDVVTVQRALGHAKATTTLNTYSHLWPTAEDRTRSASGAMLTEALAEPDRQSSPQVLAD